MSTDTPDPADGIAIIGMGGRFPGASSLEQFWRNLRDGVESITAQTKDALLAKGMTEAWLANPRFVNASTIIDDVDLFDAAFFGFNPREAEVIDPQQRLFLECCWEVLEQAGYDPETCTQAIGVYAGVGFNAYAYNLARSAEAANVGSYQLMIGNDKDFLTTRVSYKLNLRGPSVVVQTACSTSLVAVYQACESLQAYRCDMALAGGVSINVHDTRGYFYQDGMILSPDGHCRAFDAKARGTVSGKGLGVVMLKRLSDAIDDRDTIRAVIRGWAINNDGSLKVGYTAPSVEGQAQVIAEALAMSSLPAESVTYVEAHGTGTELGDPIELGALNLVYRAATNRRHFCALGSLKTNIGHLDTAAGVAGLIKTVLALEHAQLPPSLHFEEPNPQIDFTDSPFFVNTALRPWTSPDGPRRAAVSSFGIGGTNAHVVLEEAPPATASSSATPLQLLTVSARSAPALESATTRLRDYFENAGEASLADAAYTLHVGRRGFDHRRIVVCRDAADAVAVLSGANPSRVISGVRSRHGGTCAFMFSGQGSQHIGMAGEVYRHQPVFRDVFDQCATLLRPALDLDLRELLYSEDGNREAAATLLTETRITQPALFVVEYALATLMMKWGVMPAAMIGHSIGEYAAACLAGVMSLPEALALVATRGRLMQQRPAGAMLAVQRPAREVEPLLGATLSLAADNAPGLCVVAGETEAVDRLERTLAERGTFTRRLQTSHAFHSQMMDAVLPAFRAEVRRVNLQPPQRPYISNVTGAWIRSEQATDPEYWVSHLRQAVQFSEGIRTLLASEVQVLVEIGPGTTLRSLAAQHLAPRGAQVALASLPAAQDKGRSDLETVLETVGRLWIAGTSVEWTAFHGDERRRRIPLPTYPFERQRYWVDPQPQTTGRVAATATTPQKRADLATWFYAPSWKRTLPPDVGAAKALASDECWLIFDNVDGVGNQLARQLRMAGHETIRIAHAPGFGPIAPGVFSLNLFEPRDYDKMIAELKALGKHPRRVVHLAALSTSDGEGHPRLDNAQGRGVFSLLSLAQALGRQRVTRPVEMTVVSNAMHDVLPDDRVQPEQCTVLGLCTVIPQEYPTVWCTSIDVGRRALADGPDALAERLAQELQADARDAAVAYRGATRWVQTVEPALLGPARRSRFTTGATYVITGGFGKLGLALADHLARTYHARLVLTGRAVPPPRADWPVAAERPNDRTAYQIVAVQHLEGLGAEVLWMAADVADVTQLRRVVAAAEARFGSINGVIHAAGVIGGEGFRAIQELTPAHFQMQFAAKMHGLIALDEALGERQLDVRLLTSSISCELGGLGYAAYAAANHFLNGFAARAAGTASPWLAIDLDGFQFGADEGSRTALTDLLMTGAEGIEVIERALALNPRPSRLIVSTASLPARLDQYTRKALPVSRHESTSAAVEAPTGHARPALSTAFEPPADEVELGLARIWQELLGIEQVGRLDDFFELGGHSLLAVQVVSRVEQAFSVQISLRNIFEARSVAELADRIKTLVWMTQGGQPAAEGDVEDREEIEI
jgi:acyl transferase domain-containing protein